ncbi:6494_t:CDS:2 [Paraglomus brasilianum]|uniref:6494_t:CDS:1 n=1 Tax=Paraglomus brasilianum TaxID=144538 RepID=A0A9N8WDP1_9GLOM|nr:6494_t:CDS:2 [Paraglomus brasilianum]
MSAKTTVETKIKLVTDQEIAKDLKPVEGLPRRRWAVALYAVDDTGVDRDLSYVDQVEYHLHPTFGDWKRVVRKPPFTLAEKGWGEFDMKVILYFVDKSIPPHELEHDLNFSKPHYEVLHTLIFTDPKPTFRRLLPPGSTEIAKSKPGRPPKRANSSSTVTLAKKQKVETTSTRPSKTETVTTKQTKMEAPPTPTFGSPHKLSPVKTSPAKQVSSKSASPKVSTKLIPSKSTSKSTTSKSMKSESPNPSPTPPKSSPESAQSVTSYENRVTLQRLADNLYALQGDDIHDLIDIINKHRTDHMYINDRIEGEFHFDLKTMDEDLLRALWEFSETRLAQSTFT